MFWVNFKATAITLGGFYAICCVVAPGKYGPSAADLATTPSRAGYIIGFWLGVAIAVAIFGAINGGVAHWLWLRKKDRDDLRAIRSVKETFA